MILVSDPFSGNLNETGPHLVVRKRILCQNYCNTQTLCLKIIIYLHNSFHLLDELLLGEHLCAFKWRFLLWLNENCKIA